MTTTESSNNVIDVEQYDLLPCTHCQMCVLSKATTCPHCHATRKSNTSHKWQSYREGRRTDIVVAGFCFVLLWSLLVFGLMLIVGSSLFSTSTTTRSTCTPASSSYPYC